MTSRLFALRRLPIPWRTQASDRISAGLGQIMPVHEHSPQFRYYWCPGLLGKSSGSRQRPAAAAPHGPGQVCHPYRGNRGGRGEPVFTFAISSGPQRRCRVAGATSAPPQTRFAPLGPLSPRAAQILRREACAPPIRPANGHGRSRRARIPCGRGQCPGQHRYRPRRGR